MVQPLTTPSGPTVKVTTVVVVVLLIAALTALIVNGDSPSGRVHTTAGTTSTTPGQGGSASGPSASDGAVTGSSGPQKGGGQSGSASASGSGNGKGSTGAAAAAGSPAGGPQSTQAPSAGPSGGNVGPVTPCCGGGGHGSASTANLAAGGRVIKGSGVTSTQTDDVAASGSGVMLVWVMDLVGHFEAPVPSVSGLGLSWTQVITLQKKDDAPRRLTLFGASYASAPSPGPLTIDFGMPLDSSEWVWDVMQTDHSHIAQVGTNPEGGFETSHSVEFATPPHAGSTVFAGFAMGQNGPVRPGTGFSVLGQGTGPSPHASVFVEWSPTPAQRADCNWDDDAHSLAIMVEMA